MPRERTVVVLSESQRAMQGRVVARAATERTRRLMPSRTPSPVSYSTGRSVGRRTIVTPALAIATSSAHDASAIGRVLSV
jgi:hypothetical protein